MHRQPLLQMLVRYAERHANELHVVERIQRLVEASPDCFDRTCRPGHVTGSAWVVSQDRQHCLLVHHRKLNCWLQPGGHADGEHHVEQVALREVEEETGLTRLELFQDTDGLVPLDIDVHVIPERRDASGQLIEDAHEHHDIRFLIVADYDEPLVLSDESHDVCWFTGEELLEVTREESVLRMMRKSEGSN